MRSINNFSPKEGFVRFKTIFRTVESLLLALAFLGIGVVHTNHAFAQEALNRKVRSRIEPGYPDLARRMGLTGVVRLEVVVAPNGVVKETRVIGGHPILVNAAVDAVKKWRFEISSAETTGTVEIKFQPGG